MLHNVTKRQCVEYLSVLDTTLDGIIISSRDGVIAFCNQTASAMLGYADQELEGQSVEVLMHKMFRQDHVSQRADYMAATKPQPRVMNQGKRFMAVRKDGVEFPVSISLNPIDIDGKTYISASIQDMTQMEEIAIKMEQSQKLEALGEMVAGIAHNFNNVIAGISGQAYLLNKYESLSTEGHARIESVHSLCDQACDIIKQLLVYARHQKEVFSDFMLSEVIAEVVSITSITAPKHITIQLDIAEFDFQLHGMKRQIEQTLLNIINNAFHAIGEAEGVVSISVMPCADSNCKLKQCASNHDDANAYVCIKIGDTGKGISEQNIHRVFDPFFTTKPVGQGTGLGLSTSYGIIKKHGGDISVRSQPGRGTTFQIYLPVAEVQSKPATSRDVNKPVFATRASSILIIDDEPSIHHLLADILSEFGYATFTASNGQEGVDLFTQHQHEIDLVLSDLFMPKLNGYEVLAKVRTLKPNIPFIFISGCHGSAMDDAVMCDNTKTMPKPFNYTKLSHLVHDMIH